MPTFETVAELQHIPIRENGEPLVDFTKAGFVLSPRHPVFHFPRVHLLRQGVVDRLVEARRRLPSGWEIVLIEGFRPRAVQRLQNKANEMRFRASHPELSEAELHYLLEKFSAPPDDPHVPPPHVTGAAIDVELFDDRGRKADMVGPLQMEDVEGAVWDAPIGDAARRNRDILRAALDPAGITNYYGEWWHWSYGDQGWALRGGHPFAVYGPMDLSVTEAEAIQGEPADQSPPERIWPVPLPEYVPDYEI